MFLLEKSVLGEKGLKKTTKNQVGRGHIYLYFWNPQIFSFCKGWWKLEITAEFH